VTVVDVQLTESLTDVPAERIITYPGDDRGPTTESRGGHRYVRCSAAKEFAEGLHGFQPDAHLQRIDVDTTATKGEHI
jgi:hypothetical protein